MCGQFYLSGVFAAKSNTSPFSPMLAVRVVTDPFPFYRHDFFSSPRVPDLERTVTIRFCLSELLDNVGPAAAADTDPLFRVNDPQKIGLTLNEPDGKSVYRENIKRLQRHRVISAKHVLVAQQIRKIGRKRIADALIGYPGDPLCG